MNAQTILETLGRSDTPDVEVRLDLRDKRRVALTIAGFANGNGGTLLVGAQRHVPRIVGVNPSKTRRLLEKALKRLHPPPDYKWLEVMIEGEIVVVVEIPKSHLAIAVAYDDLEFVSPGERHAVRNAALLTLPAWLALLLGWVIYAKPKALAKALENTPMGPDSILLVVLFLILLSTSSFSLLFLEIKSTAFKRLSSSDRLIVKAISMVGIAAAIAGLVLGGIWAGMPKQPL